MSRTPSPRPEISLGDLTDAVRMLRPEDAATRRAIAQSLGFEVRAVLKDPGEEAAGPIAEGTPEVTPPFEPAEPETDRAPASPPRPRSERPELALQKPRRSVLEELPAPPRPRTPPIEVPPIEELLAPEIDLDDTHPPDTALLVGRWRRALLTTALSTRGAGGEVDVERLVERLSRAEPVRRVPRRLLPTLRRGVQLLLDHGEGMQPFIQDRTRMTRALRETVGEDRLQILRFAGSPRIAGAGARLSWKDYEPPLRGRPVLALTDLGIARTGGVLPEDWLALAARLQPRGSRLVVFVPYPPERWPSRLADRLTLIQWDRGTGVHDVRRALAARTPSEISG